MIGAISWRSTFFTAPRSCTLPVLTCSKSSGSVSLTRSLADGVATHADLVRGADVGAALALGHVIATVQFSATGVSKGLTNSALCRSCLLFEDGVVLL